MVTIRFSEVQHTLASYSPEKSRFNRSLWRDNAHAKCREVLLCRCARDLAPSTEEEGRDVIHRGGPVKTYTRG